MNAAPAPSSRAASAERLRRTFLSLRDHNYRLWALGALVSNVGTWMQRIAQDWLVLVDLTRHSAAAVGIVMSLQFGPPILLMPLAGIAADRWERRRMLMLTQSAMALLALGLGGLVLAGRVTLWQVYAFAAATGCVSAFDAPARQTFVAELVGDDALPNAVALNSTLFNGARLVGPAVAGLTIAAVGAGWVFVLNAASFVAVIAALARMRVAELRPVPGHGGGASGMIEGFRYLRAHPESMIALGMLFLVGTYGLNFPIFVSTMSVGAFHGGPRLYGLLSSTMALGSVAGALLVAGRKPPHLVLLRASALAFGLGCAAAALMPDAWMFGALLAVVGALAQTFTTSTNSLVQLATEPAMRGRVMAIYMGIFLGCTPLGAPLVGWVADAFGPRWALGVGAASGFAAALLATWYLRRAKRARRAAQPAAGASPCPNTLAGAREPASSGGPDGGLTVH